VQRNVINRLNNNVSLKVSINDAPNDIEMK
jgi:hypothetical protein